MDTKQAEPTAACSRCLGELFTPPGLVEVTDAAFDEQVLGSPLPVLLDIWAPWCAPCRDMEPIVRELAASLGGRLRVGKLELDRNPEAAQRLRIQGVPTLIVFNDGREVARMIGVRARSEVLGVLAEVV